MGEDVDQFEPALKPSQKTHEDRLALTLTFEHSVTLVKDIETTAVGPCRLSARFKRRG